MHLCGEFDIDDLMVGHSYFIAEDEDELKNKIKYEVIPLIREYINDGILNVTTAERNKAFGAWENLRPLEPNVEEDLQDE